MNIKNKALTLATVGLILQGCGADERDRPVTEAPVSSQAIFAPATAIQVATTPEDDGNPGDFLPFPTNLFFNGSVDGSINISGKLNSDTNTTPPAAALADPQTALNTMDGFSTTAAMVVRFSGAVDKTTVNGGIRLFEGGTVDPSTKTVIAVGRELIYGVDFVASISQGTTGLILPLKPLQPSSTYLIAVTDSLLTTTGQAVEADPEYQLLKSGTDLSATPYAALEPLRQQTNVHEDAIVSCSGDMSCTAGVPLTEADIVLSYNVSTQDVGAALSAATTQVNGAGTVPSINIHNEISEWSGNPSLALVSPGTNGEVDAADDHAAHIFLGTLQDIYQFVDPANPVDSATSNVNTSVWEGDGSGCSSNLVPCNSYTAVPKSTGFQIPVMISAPRTELVSSGGACEAANTAGLPVVVFQHGITTHRATLLALADTLAQACVVGVAIDLPKHGILPSGDPFGASAIAGAYQGFQQLDGIALANLVPERLVQVSDPSTGCQAQVGVETATSSGVYYCPAGDRYVNLENLANARDTLRQSVIDLHSLYRAISVNGFSAADIGVNADETNIHLVGMSLGGIVGATFAAQQDGLQTVSLNAMGGGIAKLLDGSPSFEPQITAGLAVNGVTKPSGDYEGFMIIAQTMVDSTDPINFTGAAGLDGAEDKVLVQEVIGDGDYVACILDNQGCPDQVVPNNLFGASFGPAWGVVAGTGQVGFLPGQNALSVPSALAGTDPFVQGTGFVAIAANFPADTAATMGPLADLGVGQFFGLGLTEAPATGGAATGLDLVRYTDGSHGSLLSPASSLAVTTLMQTQIATYIASAGAFIAADANAGTASQVVRD